LKCLTPLDEDQDGFETRSRTQQDQDRFDTRSRTQQDFDQDTDWQQERRFRSEGERDFDPTRGRDQDRRFRSESETEFGQTSRSRTTTDVFGMTFDTRQDRLAVSRIASGSFWTRFGLRQGDVITSINGVPVDSVAEFRRVFVDVEPGRRIPLVINRNGTRQTIYVTAREERLYTPYDYQYERYDTPDRGWLGVYLDTRYENHAMVEAVEVGSAADRAGVRAGDWIVAVNGQRVRSPSHLTQLIGAMEPGSRLDLQISRRNVRELEATLGERPGATRYRYEAEEAQGRGASREEEGRVDVESEVERRGSRDYDRNR
jgi:C-terminal processing protease CtpA/Prc